MRISKFIFLLSFSLSFVQPVWATALKTGYIGDEKKIVTKVKKQNNQVCGTVKRPIHYAGFVTNPPFGWVTIEESKRNKGTTYLVNNGYAYDLFFKIAKELNLEVKNVGYRSYTEALRDLRRGKIDILGGVYYNKMNYGIGMSLLYPSYIENPVVPLFVKGKEKEVKSFDDLKDLKGIIRKEELIYPMIYQQTNGLDLKQVSGSKKAFEMLIKGEVDYLLTSLYAGEAEVRRFKLVDKIHFSDIALVRPQLFYAFSSTSGCLKLKSVFEKRLRAKQKNEDAYHAYFVDHINQWGQTFKDEAGLLDDDIKIKESSSVLKNMDTFSQTEQGTGEEIKE